MDTVIELAGGPLDGLLRTWDGPASPTLSIPGTHGEMYFYAREPEDGSGVERFSYRGSLAPG